MISNCSLGLCILLQLILICQGRNGPDFFYPESEEQNPAKQNAMDKRPIAFHGCKPGEVYYPGDQGDDWVCDCRPGYIYHPLTSQCYAAFTKGPCRDSEYLILPKTSVIPECIQNPCKKDNYVLFNNGCHQLDKPGPCPVPELDNVIGVNETTLEIICTKGFNNLLTRIDLNDSKESTTSTTTTTTTTTESPIVNGSVPYYKRKECFIGGKRWTEETCPQQIIEKETIDSIFSHPQF